MAGGVLELDAEGRLNRLGKSGPSALGSGALGRSLARAVFVRSGKKGVPDCFLEGTRSWWFCREAERKTPSCRDFFSGGRGFKGPRQSTTSGNM